jgi:hypothetical protein
VEKVGDVWNEAAGSDAVKAVGDVLDVAKVKLSSGLPMAGGTDKVVPSQSQDTLYNPNGACAISLVPVALHLLRGEAH